MSKRPESAARVWDASEATKAICDFVAGKTKTEFFDELLLRSEAGSAPEVPES
ncbi:hypothetical protein [Arthrobacter castelli]|uniref:hypothetical protein n=1 Tax=Arthrobacter castelli TaxID=271431 RepID=UPI000422DF6A|nr:hypothetical protein [Arthrobacter castelli]